MTEKMTEKMTIVLPGVPPSLNVTAGRKNVWAYREAKAEWTQRVWAACMASKDRPKKPWEKSVVEITYYFPTQGRHDADNYAGKFLLDGLTKAGVIVDDDLKHISTAIHGDYDKDNPQTEITVLRCGAKGR